MEPSLLIEPSDCSSLNSRQLGVYLSTYFQNYMITQFFSVISYGTAIWGHKQFKCKDAIQNYACRFFLGLGRYAPNSAVIGDMGWPQMHVKQWDGIIRQFRRLCDMDETRIYKHIFVWADSFKNRVNNWNGRVHTR